MLKSHLKPKLTKIMMKLIQWLRNSKIYMIVKLIPKGGKIMKLELGLIGRMAQKSAEPKVCEMIEEHLK